MAYLVSRITKKSVSREDLSSNLGQVRYPTWLKTPSDFCTDLSVHGLCDRNAGVLNAGA